MQNRHSYCEDEEEGEEGDEEEEEGDEEVIRG
jgi:hypothetical protein